MKNLDCKKNIINWNNVTHSSYTFYFVFQVIWDRNRKDGEKCDDKKQYCCIFNPNIFFSTNSYFVILLIVYVFRFILFFHCFAHCIAVNIRAVSEIHHYSHTFMHCVLGTSKIKRAHVLPTVCLIYNKNKHVTCFSLPYVANCASRFPVKVKRKMFSPFSFSRDASAPSRFEGDWLAGENSSKANIFSGLRAPSISPSGRCSPILR